MNTIYVTVQEMWMNFMSNISEIEWDDSIGDAFIELIQRVRKVLLTEKIDAVELNRLFVEGYTINLVPIDKLTAAEKAKQPFQICVNDKTSNEKFIIPVINVKY